MSSTDPSLPLGAQKSVKNVEQQQQSTMWRFLSLPHASHISTENDLSVQTFCGAPDREKKRVGRTQNRYTVFSGANLMPVKKINKNS